MEPMFIGCSDYYRMPFLASLEKMESVIDVCIRFDMPWNECTFEYAE